MIGRALADAPTLWQQEPTAIAGLLRELIAAIPNRQDAATLRQVMEQVACGMVEHAQPSRRIVRLIQTIRIELLRALSGTDVAFERELASASSSPPNAKCQPVSPPASPCWRKTSHSTCGCAPSC